MSYDEPLGKFMSRIRSMLESVDWEDETSGPNNDDLNRLSEIGWGEAQVTTEGLIAEELSIDDVSAKYGDDMAEHVRKSVASIEAERKPAPEGEKK